MRGITEIITNRIAATHPPLRAMPAARRRGAWAGDAVP
jgi:hypothetical protein